MSDLSNLGPGSDELHDRARRRDEELRRRIEQGGIPVDHGIREEITPEQREEWAERTRRHADEEDKIIDKMRGRTPPTTKSFSGLLKSLRAKYGIKSVDDTMKSEEAEDASNRERQYEEMYVKDNSKDVEENRYKGEEQDRTRSSNMEEDADRVFGGKSYSSQVPIPHGNLSKTNIPPVEWEPGVGAKALSELASFFKAMSDEKAFGQVHREKALELLQKAAPYNLLFQDQQEEKPAVNRVYSTMSRGELAFDPNPVGPPASGYTPTQEEIWQQVVEDAAREGKEPAFHPTEDENIPYAEPHRGYPAFIFPEQKAFKVGDRVQEVGSNPKNPQVNGPHGEITWVPKGNDQNSTVDYQMDDGDFTVSARADQLYKTPAKALSVLNSFLKAFYKVGDNVSYSGGNPNSAPRNLGSAQVVTRVVEYPSEPDMVYSQDSHGGGYVTDSDLLVKVPPYQDQ